MSIRVLIADDQAMVRTGFRMILETEPDLEVVGEAQDGQEAVELCAALRPDIVVMDIRMPRLDGVAATQRLLAAGSGPRVVMVTTFDDDQALFDALEAGVSGFLLKNSPPEQLIDAIRTAASGDALLSPAVTARVISEFSARRPRSRPVLDLSLLTNREQEVLVLVGRGLSNEEIAEKLVISAGTAKTHVARVMMKLNLPTRALAVVAAYESGLIIPGGS